MKPAVRSLIPALIASTRVRAAQRGLAALGRRLSGARPVVRYFHQADDPHSWLAARALGHLADQYGVDVRAHLVPPPDAAAAPDRERLSSWSLGDAQVLAAGLGLRTPPSQTPPPDLVRAAEAALAGIDNPHEFAAVSAAIEAAWSHGAAMPGPSGNAQAALASGAALRARLGHYLGAAFHFEGEWYWGLDRLGYLETRLAAVTGCKAAPFSPRLEVSGSLALDGADAGRRPRIDAFISLRSPYTWIAMDRLITLAEAYNADLRLRPVLPMVMRGLPVPRAKRLYIVRDTKREAERLGLPFGRIADPVGRPAERGLAVLFHAMTLGRGPDFARAFLKGVFADGIDAGMARGLDYLGAQAGLAPADIRAGLADDSWRAQAEANREAMLALGVWGVPAFQVDDRPAHWGQDRLWAVERDLQAAHAAARGA
ncbi:MAG: DsbA family protein [Oceanicaulis sp.]|nr:DsbA family protein [Oceanicaulis sp.]